MLSMGAKIYNDYISLPFWQHEFGGMAGAVTLICIHTLGFGKMLIIIIFTNGTMTYYNFKVIQIIILMEIFFNQ